MANQTIGVNLKFSADVSAAKRAMAELQGSLAQIHNAAATSANPGIRYAKDLNQASQAAAQLRIQLQSAFNQDTGKLNLTKFNMEMKQAGMSVEKYRVALTSIGPQGQQAFTQLAHSVAMAETNTINLSAGIQRLGTTFMNTLRYQLSSTVIMGFVQGISEAVTYVKDLNASLNDIRIVTNYGVDEMKEFANHANKAAKALSTTTNEYAKASLIYFQQGLTDEEVQKRTDLTIKMANVTGQAVGEVSDQLTSVWNNFDNGTKSLEHYVDVMVALGAVTASSSEEISEGLNKFAAVAETVGLSYEYAAAALATVTATTRQSADIVGTAFKTLFARIQDLELGKELDDGTTLGQYSQALATVGINIKDVNGEVKDMNSILDEMGVKWNTLSKDSQIALAQNVAGVRQYTQLIALMDNWDFFKQNLETANASTGSLQEQADIYAESWEAASQRVTASLETIYSKLLNDEFFIDATNLLADFIGLVENLIDGLGGMPGVLALVGVALTKVFSTQIAQGINNMAYNIRSMTKAGKAENARLQQEFANAATEQYGIHGASGQQGILAKEEAKLQEIAIRNKGKMTELEQQQLDTRINELRIQKQQIDREIEQTKILEQQASLHKRISQTRMSSKSLLGRQEGFSRQEIDNADVNNNYAGSQVVQGTRGSFLQMNQQEQERAYSALYSSSAALQINAGFDIGDEDTFSALRFNSPQNSQQYSKAIEELQSRLKSLGITAEGVDAQMQDIIGPELSSEYQSLAKAVEQAQKEIYEYAAQVSAGKITEQEFRDKVSQSTKAVRDAEHQLQLKTSSMQKDSQEAIRLAGGTNEATEAIIANGTAAGESQRKIMNLGQQYDLAGKNAEKSAIRILDFGTAMQQSAMMISTLTMVVTSLIGLFKTLSDEEIDPSEKITTTLTTLGFMLPMVIGLFNDQTKSLFRTFGAYLLAAGGADKAGIAAYKSGKMAHMGSLGWLGLVKTIGKFAIYAVAIGAVILAVTTLAKAADDARNSVENFAVSAAQGAKDAAEAYSEATTAFNELKQSIESYENALTGLQKLTKGTNEYKQALFDANEQALALVQSHTGLKYYIDSNGLIVFDEGELDRIEEEAQQKKADAYSAKLSADRGAREAAIENQKVSLGRKLKGEDNEWNDEDDAAVLTGASVGTASAAVAGFAGAKIGAALGTALAPGVGTAIGAGIGVVLGGITGLITGAIEASKNDATSQEKEAMDALYEAYKEQGSAALTEDGIRAALNNIGIDDENLIKSLAANKDSTEDLMKAMEANTAAIEAETLMAATQQAHALDPTLQYRDSEVQNAVTKALARARTAAEETAIVDSNSYRDKKLFGAYYSHTDEGKKDFEAYLREQGLGDQVNAIYEDSNFSKDYIEYEYIDENGDTQEKKLTYAQLAAWKTAKNIDAVSNDSYDNIIKAINSAQEFFGDGSEGLLSIIGGQNLISLSEKELKDFKSAFDTGKYDEYITNNWKALGYESEKAFTKAIAEGIANWDYETAFGQFSKRLNAEINGILSAGAEETEYTAGALENYTDALAENNEALHDNADAWSNLEKKKFAAQAAVANAKFVKGVDALTEVLEDNLEILLRWDEASLDTYEAADKVQTALEDVFGVRVSADFIKNNLADIQKLAQGSTENLEELSRAAAVDFVLNIDTLSESSKNALEGAINELSSKKIEIGADIEDKAFIQSLNAMLSQGEVTAEQIQQAFGAIGYAPDIKYRTDKQKTTTKHYIYDNGDMSSKPRIVIQETETDIQVPYIAGEGTQSMATDDKGSQENGSGITKMRDIGSIGASLSDTKKQNTDKLKELDRYHEIKEELADIERGLNKIAKAKDRAFGKAKLDLIDQEIKQQEKLNAAEQKYLEEIQKYYKKDLENLDSRFELDENGRIKNYTDVLQGLINSGITGDAYEEIKKSADQYEETLNELEAQQEVINDSINEAADLALERIEYNVEIKVHFNDRDIKHFNFLLEKLDDPLQDAAEAIALIGKTAASNLGNIDAYIGGIEEILGQSFSDSQSKAFQNLLANMPSAEDLPSTLSEILGDAEFTDDQVTALEKYVDSLYDTSGALDDFYTQVMEQVNGAFDDMNEKSEKAISRTEQLGATLQTYQNIIDLVGKKALGVTNEQIRALGRAQIAQAKATLETKQGQLEMNRTALAAAEAKKKAAEESEDGEAVKYWEEQIETIQDKVWTLEGEVETAWSDTLQSIADDFQNAVDTATSAFEESMTGIYGSYEKMQEAFDQQQEISDRYVEDYKKIYELSKLNRDLNKSIDSTDSIKGKQALRDLQEEINALQESDAEMSEYDLQYLRKKYELRVAEIALEEAQNAKSQVRMQRDAEGNWGYVYTADEAKVDSAQQSYEDKLYAMQKFNQAYMDEMQSAIIQTEADMLAAIAQLHEEDYASQEEYLKAVDEVRKYYTDKRNYYFSELQKSIGNNKTLYNEDWQSYSENTGYKISKAEDWKDSFEETEYALVTKYPDIETAQRTFTENSKILVQDLTDAYDQWQQDVSDAFDLVGKDFEDFAKEGGELDQRTREVEEKLGKVTSEFNSWKPTAESAFQGIIDAAEDKFDDFSSEISQYQEKITNVTNALREMLRLAGEKIPDKQLNTDTGGVKGNTNGGSTVPSTIPPKTPTTTTPNYYKTKTYSLKGEKINDRTQEVLEKGAFKFTKEELASAKRSTPWSSYFDIIKDGYTYSIAENDYLQALTESGQSDLYKAAEKNPFTTANTSPDNKPPWGVGDTVTFKKGALTGAPFEFKDRRGQAGDDITYSDVDGYKFTIVHNYDQYGWVGKTDLPINGWPYFYIWKTDLERLDGYDTGGYTGSWDSSGRLAMLHQKEIVLNAHDTENFLAAINIVRDIASAIDLRAAAQQSALSQITAASVSPMTQTLEQEVTIHAEFPNATQRTEIEAAFDTLLNRASQFANRKNK